MIILTLTEKEIKNQLFFLVYKAYILYIKLDVNNY